jgi:Glycosyltransferase WbsX
MSILKNPAHKSFGLIALIAALCYPSAWCAEPIQVAAYYYPCWGSPPESEWPSLAKARPRFPNHNQPKTPVWGMQDERDPQVMAQKIDAAADYGLNAFIFCWYAYDGGKHYLDDALRKGFLKAANRDRLKFALMWANQDIGSWGTGRVKPETWDGVMDEVIHDYFSQPNYWRIKGCPYFSIYNPREFIASFGSVEKAARALQCFRAKAVAVGLPGLHLNAILYGTTVQEARALGFDSLTSYVWLHHQIVPTFPSADYASCRDNYFVALRKGGGANGLEQPAAEFDVPYFPNVTMGWDSSPRCPADAPWKNGPYPFGPVLVNNTPAAFLNALRQAVSYLETSKTTPRILTIYAWNEWTEGGYLEPEMRTGMSYLEAIRQVILLDNRVHK